MADLSDTQDPDRRRRRGSSPPARDDDAALVAAAQAGDQAAFGELARRHSPRLRRVLARVTGSQEAAQDALQEALVRSWQNIARFEGRSSFFTWLTRIGINECYRTIQRRDPASIPLDDAVGERVPSWGARPAEVFESREFLAAVADALRRLPQDHRAAVVLRDVEGLSTAEAASVLGVEEAALKSRLHRGRMALRRNLDSYFTTASK